MGLFTGKQTETAAKVGRVTPGNFFAIGQEGARSRSHPQASDIVPGINVAPLGTIFRTLLDVWKTEEIPAPSCFQDKEVDSKGQLLIPC